MNRYTEKLAVGLIAYSSSSFMLFVTNCFCLQMQHCSNSAVINTETRQFISSFIPGCFQTQVFTSFVPCT